MSICLTPQQRSVAFFLGMKERCCCVGGMKAFLLARLHDDLDTRLP